MIFSLTTTNKKASECCCTCNKNKRLPSSKMSSSLNNITMEDVWREINLTSLNTPTTTQSHSHSHSHSHPITTTAPSNSRCVNFQEYHSRSLTFTMAGDSPTRSASASPSLTALSLTPFDPLIRRHNNKDLQLPPQLPRHHPPNQNRKRPLFQSDDCNDSGERRNKRMIKNRESAARSRARKQAYTFELQQKVKHLQEENARLKRQQQLLCQTAVNQQQKKKGTLYRTYTAPF